MSIDERIRLIGALAQAYQAAAGYDLPTAAKLLAEIMFHAEKLR